MSSGAQVIRVAPAPSLEVHPNPPGKPSFSASCTITAISALFLAARLWRLTTYSLRPDEIFSLKAARGTWTELLASAAHDVVHPPLFYLLLKVWILLGGQSERWLRLLPVSFAILSIYPFVVLCRELKLTHAETNLGMLLMAVNGYLIYYSQELRMYSLLLLLTLCSLALFARWIAAPQRRRTSFLFLFLLNLLLVYTHYYAWLVIAAELVLVVAMPGRRARRFAGAAILLLLGFLPWAMVASRAAAAHGGLEPNIGSFPRPHLLADVVGYYAILSGPLFSGWKRAAGVLLFVFPVLAWACNLHRSRGVAIGNVRRTFWWLVLLSVAPVCVAYIASHVLRESIWGTRFLIIVAAPYMILVSVSVFSLRPNILRNAVVAIMVSWAAIAGWHEVNNSGKNAWPPLVRKMIATESASASGVMIYTFGSSDETIQFYLDEAHDQRFRTRRVSDIRELQGEHFWVAFRESHGRSSPQQELIRRGYAIRNVFRDGFDGVLFLARR